MTPTSATRLWYDNTGSNTGADPSNDIMTVEISTNNGANWSVVEDDRTPRCSFERWLVSRAASRSPASELRATTACFVSTPADDGDGSVIEAAVDAFNVENVICDEDDCPAEDSNGDVNGDGVVDGVDLSIILGNWGADFPAADFNCDGVIEGSDLSDHSQQLDRVIRSCGPARIEPI